MAFNTTATELSDMPMAAAHGAARVFVGPAMSAIVAKVFRRPILSINRMAKMSPGNSANVVQMIST